MIDCGRSSLQKIKEKTRRTHVGHWWDVNVVHWSRLLFYLGLFRFLEEKHTKYCERRGLRVDDGVM